MPWHIEQRNGQFCVIKDTDGENEGCHATRNEANAQIRALYASEASRGKDDGHGQQEMPMDKATWTTAYVNNLPDSAFLHVESGGEKDGDGKTTPRQLRHFPYKDAQGNVDLPHLRNALSRLGQSDTGSSGGERWLTAELRRSLIAKARRILGEHQKSALDKAVAWLKGAFGLDEPEPEPAQAVNSFMVWKEADGRWRWLGIYSNKFRDADNPPEILSEQAHLDFIKAVDQGEWPLPELWLWHVPQSVVGKTDWLAYDDRGFSLAAGTLDPAYGEALQKQEPLGVSHGMPVTELRRDETDNTIITRYRSKEISVLPPDAAANKLTGFHPIGGQIMAIPQEKATFLKSVLGDERVAELDKELEGLSKEAEGLEFKEGEPEVEVAEPVEEPEQAEPAPEAEVEIAEPDEAPAIEYATREEVADAVGEVMAGVQSQVEALSGQMAEMVGQVTAIEKALAQLKEEDEAKIADAAKETPGASLAAMMAARMRAVGSEQARIDGRTTLAKSGPAENEAHLDGPTMVPFLNQIMSAQRGGRQ